MNLEKYGLNPTEAVGLIGVGAALGGAAVRCYMNSLLHDEGHRVFVAPNFDALQVVLDVCEDNGLEPAREITDEKVSQALMSDNRTVFLVTRPDVWEEMGQPTAAPMLKVKKPAEAAEKAKSLLQEKGFSAEIIDTLGDQTDGEILFVKTDALSCGLMGFREHVVKMGSKPPKWNPQKTPSFDTKS